MRYDLTLRLTYEYDEPVTFGREVLRLTPLDLPGEQQVASCALNIRPLPDDRRVGLDFWGNETVSVVHRSPQRRLEYVVRARVERLPQTGAPGASATLGELSGALEAHRGLEGDAPHHFRGPSPRVPASPDITAYARRAVAAGMTVAAAVEAVGTSLHRDMTFDPGATEVDTSVEEAFRRRHGVCQDFTHVMIAALRGVGIPAGYVSGCLRTIPPESTPPLEGADAMHAWVRAWCGPERGWMEYDPTNAMHVRQAHIAIARGRDYGDIAPIKGVLRTSGTQKAQQAVDVVPVE
jgi:transglutaminase-like putative cysteine protease